VPELADPQHGAARSRRRFSGCAARSGPSTGRKQKINLAVRVTGDENSHWGLLITKDIIEDAEDSH
jgi:hypothetical protein